MSLRQYNVLGQVYHCEVCGAEISVVKGADGELAPRCCNQPMALLPELHGAFFCPIRGSELMVINEDGGELVPRCCNRPMIRRKQAA